MTSPKNFERVRQVIEELDRAVPQVLIKVLIAEVTHDNTLDYGTEFSVLNLRADGTGQSGETIGTDFGVAAATSGGLVVRLLETDVTATLRALERRGKLDVLSRPYILASDNQLASITVGQNVPFPTNSRTTDDGDILTSIDYRDVGILLDVVPHINPDGLVIMDVQPTISALTASTVQISEEFNAPIVNTRSALSRVSIDNGKTIVIGGLMEDRKSETIRKVPVLGDVPLLGQAFRRTERTKTKTELLIFLTPHVASSPDKLPAMSEDETRGTKLLDNAVQPGAYDFHREGLQRGATQVAPRGGARTGGNAVRDVTPGPSERPRRRPTTMPAE
jgi:general secretion pathway protein D